MLSSLPSGRVMSRAMESETTVPEPVMREDHVVPSAIIYSSVDLTLASGSARSKLQNLPPASTRSFPFSAVIETTASLLSCSIKGRLSAVPSAYTAAKAGILVSCSTPNMYTFPSSTAMRIA